MHRPTSLTGLVKSSDHRRSQAPRRWAAHAAARASRFSKVSGVELPCIERGIDPQAGSWQEEMRPHSSTLWQTLEPMVAESPRCRGVRGRVGSQPAAPVARKAGRALGPTDGRTALPGHGHGARITRGRGHGVAAPAARIHSEALAARRPPRRLTLALSVLITAGVAGRLWSDEETATVLLAGRRRNGWTVPQQEGAQYSDPQEVGRIAVEAPRW